MKDGPTRRVVIDGAETLGTGELARTETAMTRAHCFPAMEPASQAQASATRMA